MTAHDATLAFPIGANADKSEARNLCVKRFPYVLQDAESSLNLVAVDPDVGSIVEDLMYLGRIYHLDPLDSTTAHDGTSTLVSFEGKRYKLTSQTADVWAWAVIDNTHTAPPATSPSAAIGDAYLVAVGATGAWAGKDNYVAIFTARGWEFVNLGTGRLIYVKTGTNADTYFHRKTNGTWVAGIGAQTITANSVPVSAIIGKPVRWIVENQTTNTPPGSPSIGDAYVIGTSPTGAWAGNTGKIAICEVGTTFTIYAPRDGELIYDKSQKVEFRYDSGVPGWLLLGGALIASASLLTTSGSTTTGGTGNYTYSDTTPPTTSLAYLEDGATHVWTARKAGARLRFFYQYLPSNGNIHNVALFRDADANAIDWMQVMPSAGSRGNLYTLETTAGDTSSHTYKIRLIQTGATIPTPSRRRFTIEEFA